MKNIIAITQARFGSSRFPGKILNTINNISLLEIHLKRVLNSKLINKLIVATTNEAESFLITTICEKLNIQYFKGSTEDVLMRFYDSVKFENPDYIVRLTSDCPLIDAEEIDNVIKFFLENDLDYVSNSLNPTFPDGLDVEIFKYEALKIANNSANLKSEREHVTSFIWKNSSYFGKKMFKADCYLSKKDYSNYRITVDTLEDFLVIKQMVNLIGDDQPWLKYIELIANNKIKIFNSISQRNSGYSKSISNE